MSNQFVRCYSIREYSYLAILALLMCPAPSNTGCRSKRHHRSAIFGSPAPAAFQINVCAAWVAFADMTLPLRWTTTYRTACSPSIVERPPRGSLDAKCTYVTQAFSMCSRVQFWTYPSCGRSLSSRFVINCCSALQATSILTLCAR